MTFDRINPPELAAPRGFSHAVSTTRQRTVYLAGQTALDASSTIVGDDMVSQFEQALSNLLAALAAAGGTGGDLATVTIYVADMDDYRASSRELGAVWSRLVGTDYPAMAAVEVPRLWDADALVEVQGIAVLE
jgi:enamine deaminase RidA (YjgF/YER057c/UK114 family)